MDNRKHLIEKSLAEKKCVDDNQYYYQQETEMVPIRICRVTVYGRKNLWSLEDITWLHHGY